MSKASNKNVYKLPEHSKAKIACYINYLRMYLNILAYSPFEKIYILDLFAGEGRDIANEPCSSVAAAEIIEEHYNQASKTCNNILFYLNDSGMSVIDTGTKKIDRVKMFIDKIKIPSNVEIKYTDKKFEDIIDSLIIRLQRLQLSERALCFIDPFGYKYSKPEKIKGLLDNGKTEVLLFIPVCFLHRFAAKAVKDEDFVEGKHIEEFLSVIFNKQIPEIGNQIAFIKKIESQFKIYLQVPYVDVTYIEKERGQFFALFFFSNNKLGFEKMLEAKWKVDELNGHGFKMDINKIRGSLFENLDHDDYTNLLYSEIVQRKRMSNQQVFDFGLNNNHLPKHSTKVLQQLKKDKKIRVLTEEGYDAPGFYIDDKHEKTVYFTPKI